jgi:hypothetical protein
VIDDIVDAEPMDDPETPEGPLPGVPSVTGLRLAAYQQRSDPLFFKWQRGEATEQEWLDEVAAIRAEFPDT